MRVFTEQKVRSFLTEQRLICSNDAKLAREGNLINRSSILNTHSPSLSDWIEVEEISDRGEITHHCGNVLTDKEIEFDHCLKCSEFLHNTEEEEQSESSRCCGRCDGVNDLCFTDMACEDHKVRGCEICYGEI